MIKLRVMELAKSRGIKHVHTYLVRFKISRRVASKIINDTIIQLTFSDMLKLCDMFKCYFNDLYIYEPKNKEEAKQRLWLVNILPRTGRTNIPDMLTGLTEEELKKLEGVMKEVVGKK